ncbi:restriction endonuclease [Nocardia farcinica]|uniref:restriction endonuclease n=1 Tax=Nocardia farcinica TaxID=37329 RepID=UPI002457BF43|nr:restriction endonuclease [Nocardia farcinica]
MPYIRTPQEAERNAAARMREMGFADAAVTAGGADGGVDVRASRAIAQVKWRGGMVSRPEVQKLFGARGSDYGKQLLFFAASDYSQHAVAFADTEGIALFVYEPDGCLAARNRHGAALLSHSATSGRQARTATLGSGFLARKVEHVVTVHWRIIGAVFFTCLALAGLAVLIAPDPGQDRLDALPGLVVGVVLAVVFWRLYSTDRARKRGPTAD